MRDRTYDTPLIARIDAIQLALRYFELVLLRILGCQSDIQIASSESGSVGRAPSVELMLIPLNPGKPARAKTLPDRPL